MLRGLIVENSEFQIFKPLLFFTQMWSNIKIEKKKFYEIIFFIFKAGL